MFKQNCLGGNFENGKSTPLIMRQRIINKYSQGVPICKISKNLQITERGVSSYEETGSIDPKVHCGRNHYKTTDDVLQHIEYMKTRKPSTYGREIKNKLLEHSAFAPNNISRSSTRTWFYQEALTIIPEESLTDAAQEKQVRFLEEIADFPARNMLFMDECSVDRTSEPYIWTFYFWRTCN